MVLLTMTPTLVEALEKLQSNLDYSDNDEDRSQTTDMEPSIAEPKVGKAISHGQVLNIYRQLKKQLGAPYRLEDLLKGSKVYIPPPTPKPEPTSEYKALMVRLRAAEESRAYDRLLNPPAEPLSVLQPTAAHAFAATSSFDTTTSEELAVVFKELNRQLMVVFNILFSIVACAAAIWVAAKWWSTPARLALSMGGSLLVGTAEVVVYFGYIRRVEEAKGMERKVKEVKEIVKTWVVGEAEEEREQLLVVGATGEKERSGIRERIPRKLEDT